MKITVAQRTYQMSQEEYEGLLQVASEQVPFGIYAVEKQRMRRTSKRQMQEHHAAQEIDSTV